MIKESIIRFTFNKIMERYGQMLKLDIDSENKSISAEVLLKGEDSPLKVYIGRYEILGGNESGIKISQIQTSKEWMTELIQAVAPEHTVNFNYAKLLKIFM